MSFVITEPLVRKLVETVDAGLDGSGVQRGECEGGPMMDWLFDFVVGMAAAWLALLSWERLQVWWREGKDDLEVEVMDHEDPHEYDRLAMVSR